MGSEIEHGAGGFGVGRPPEVMRRQTGFLLNWVAAGSRQRFASAMAELGLSAPQFLLMNVIAEDPGSAQSELVEATHIDPSTMVAFLDALQDAGLAERRGHPKDRRKSSVYLTGEGEKVLGEARRAAGAVAAETFGALSDDDSAELRRIVELLAFG